MFIAPQGAMQFEITHPDTPYRGEVLWVVPLPPGAVLHFANWECKCGRRYEALADSVSAKLRPAMRADLDVFVVCECVGKLIE